MSAAGLERIHFAILVFPPDRRIRVPVIDTAKVHVDIVRVRFAGPVHDHRRNLHLGATAQVTGIRHVQKRRAARHRIRMHPHRIAYGQHRIEFHRLADFLALGSDTTHAVVVHAERLLEHHAPARRVLVICTLVPAAGILLPVERQRAHLHRIVHVDYEHRGRHVVPRRKQPHHLRLERVIDKVLRVHRGAREHPHLVNAGRENVRSQRPLVIVKVLVRRPFVLPAVQLHPRPRRVPLRRTHQRIVEIDMTPVLVLPFRRKRRRLVHDVVVDRDIERAVAVARIRTPRVIDMQPPRRVETFPLRTYRKRRFRSTSRTVDIDRIRGGKGRRKFHHRIAIRREGEPRSLVAYKVSVLHRVCRHHRRRHGTVEPSALRSIARHKAHQHGIRPENHLRKRTVPPRALEPHDLRTRCHERLLVRPVRLRVHPEFRFRTEELANLELIRAPCDTVVLVVVVIRSIRTRLYVETHPVLEIGQRLAHPRIGEPAVPIGLHHRRRSRVEMRIVVATRTTQHMRHIIAPCRIVTPR